jgi:ABC-type glucose/galactose transport system permease subunit
LGRGYELNAIAAAVVGGCSLQGGAGTIPGAALGCLFLRVVIDGVAKIIKSGADIYEGLIVGNVVVIAVALNQPTIRRRLLPGPLGTVMVVVLALYAAILGLLFSGQQAAVLVGGATFALLGVIKYREGRRESTSSS